ncbi:MAG: hypothetical protein IPJ62_13955 [Betaproteobacteria bacterium]|nr:hypothetical protein [Betaproteobacteria bacterium]
MFLFASNDWRFGGASRRDRSGGTGPAGVHLLPLGQPPTAGALDALLRASSAPATAPPSSARGV